MLVIRIGEDDHGDAAVSAVFTVVDHHKVTSCDSDRPYAHFFTLLVDGVGVGSERLDQISLVNVDIVLLSVLGVRHNLKNDPGREIYDSRSHKRVLISGRGVAVNSNFLLSVVILKLPRSIVLNFVPFSQLCSAGVDKLNLLFVEVEGLHALGPVGHLDEVLYT